MPSILSVRSLETSHATLSMEPKTARLRSSPPKVLDVCGHSVLFNFMFMKDGEVYFFALLDEIDVTVENAKLAFEASTTTAVSVTLDDYLTLQLGAYLFNKELAGAMIERYLDDVIYLISEDESLKELIARTK